MDWHQEGKLRNHAGHAFQGNATAVAKYWVNRGSDEIDHDWCVKQIKRQKRKLQRNKKYKYDRNRIQETS